MECLFCKIIKKEEPADIIYEDEEILGFKNIQPEAPIHLLFTTKKHLEWKDQFQEKDLMLLTKIISVAKKVALEKEASKFIFNIGQTSHFEHIHLHLLTGWREDVPMHNV